MRTLAVLTAAGLLVALATTNGEAQFRFGANVSWADDTDFGVGARGSFGIGGAARGRPIEGLVTFDYFFPDGFDYWEVSGNGVYRLNTSETVKATPYIGAGVVLGRASVKSSGGVCNLPGVECDNTSVGLNLLGGLRLRAANRFLPFVEGRFEMKDGSQLVLTAGTFFGKW
jgi:hypothetical protein